jgi:hypothetical protein
MFEALQNLENIVRHFDGTILIITGILSLMVGLSIWLGGMRWPFSVGIVAGSVVGLMAIGIFSSVEPQMLFPFTFLGTCLVLIFARRVSFALIASVIAAVACLLFVSAPAFSLETKWNNPQYSIAQQGQPVKEISTPEITNILQKHLLFMAGKIGLAVKEIHSLRILIAASVGILVFLFGLIMPRLIGSATCAVIGTAVIFIAMCILLCQKSTQPINAIIASASFYQTVALCMLAFGTISGLIFGKKKKRKLNDSQKQGE